MAKTQDAPFYASAMISDNIVTTPEGYLLCVGVPIARTGELLYSEGELLNADGEEVIEPLDGKITVTRDDASLFDPKTMASFEGKAVTIGHPADFVSPLNWQSLANGHMQNVRRGTGADADKLLADLLLVTAQSISLIKNGLREVSLGYDAAYEQVEPGVGVQTEIMGNHVALVRKGRNGSEVAVRDSAPEIKPWRNKMTAKAVAASGKAKLMKLLGRALDEAMPDEVPATTDEGDDVEARIANIEAMLTKISAMCDGTTDEAPPAAPAADPVKARLDAIEKALTALAEKMSGNAAAAVVDEKPPVVPAKDEAGKAIANDAETIARVELLAPGFVMNEKTTIKDVMAEFGKTEDGAAILKTLDSIKDDQALLLTASELIKTKRSVGVAPLSIAHFPALARTGDAAKGAMTPEMINEANAKRYAPK